MQLCNNLNILWHCLSLEWKLTFSSPVPIPEISKFTGIMSAGLSQHHFLGFEIAQLEFHHPGIHDGVIIHLEPDILEYKVKWALGSITKNKPSGGDGILAELLQVLKDDAVKVLHSICQQILKTQQWPQNWKRSVFIPIPKKGNAKECSNYHTIALLSHSSKVMLKILQARL